MSSCCIKVNKSSKLYDSNSRLREFFDLKEFKKSGDIDGKMSHDLEKFGCLHEWKVMWFTWFSLKPTSISRFSSYSNGISWSAIWIKDYQVVNQAKQYTDLPWKTRQISVSFCVSLLTLFLTRMPCHHIWTSARKSPMWSIVVMSNIFLSGVYGETTQNLTNGSILSRTRWMLRSIFDVSFSLRKKKE